jgi:hypothetical protein
MPQLCPSKCTCPARRCRPCVLHALGGTHHRHATAVAAHQAGPHSRTATCLLCPRPEQPAATLPAGCLAPKHCPPSSWPHLQHPSRLQAAWHACLRCSSEWSSTNPLLDRGLCMHAAPQCRRPCRATAKLSSGPGCIPLSYPKTYHGHPAHAAATTAQANSAQLLAASAAAQFAGQMLHAIPAPMQ